MTSKEETQAYSKGYAAGRKRRHREEFENQIRNDRATALAAAILAAGMNGGWGAVTEGEFKKHSLPQLQKMAVKAAREMVNEMGVL